MQKNKTAEIVLLIESAKSHEINGDYPGMRKVVLEAVKAVDQSKQDSPEIAHALLYAAKSHQLLHYHSQADDLLRRAQMIFEESNDQVNASLTTAKRVKCRIWMRDLQGAEHLLKDLEHGFNSDTPANLRGECASAHGHISFRRADWNDSYRCFIAAKNLFVKSGDKKNELLALNGIAGVCCEIERFDEAYDLLTEALTGFKKLEDRRRIWDIQVNLATLCSYMGDHHESREKLLECLQMSEKMLEPEYRGRVLFNLGVTELFLGEYRAARKNLLRATQAGQSQSVPSDLGEAQTYLALAELGLGNLPSTEQYLIAGENQLEHSGELLVHSTAACRALLLGASELPDLAKRSWDDIKWDSVQLQDDYWRVVPFVIKNIVTKDSGAFGGISEDAKETLDNFKIDLERRLAESAVLQNTN